MHREPQHGQTRKGACLPNTAGISRDGDNDRTTVLLRGSPNAVRNKKRRPRTTEEVRGRRDVERNRAVADAACRRVVRHGSPVRGKEDEPRVWCAKSGASALLSHHARRDDAYIFERAIVGVGRHALYFVDHRKAFHHFAEHGVLTVEMRCAAGVFIFFGHGRCDGTFLTGGLIDA